MTESELDALWQEWLPILEDTSRGRPVACGWNCAGYLAMDRLFGVDLSALIE